MEIFPDFLRQEDGAACLTSHAALLFPIPHSQCSITMLHTQPSMQHYHAPYPIPNVALPCPIFNHQCSITMPHIQLPIQHYHAHSQSLTHHYYVLHLMSNVASLCPVPDIYSRVIVLETNFPYNDRHGILLHIHFSSLPNFGSELSLGLLVGILIEGLANNSLIHS